MTALDLVMEWARAVRDDAGIAAWATERYGSPHRVYVGYDTRNVPTEPCVVLFAGWVESEEGARRTATLKVGWMVRQKAVDADGELRVYRGGAEADGLGRLVRACLERAGGGYLESGGRLEVDVWDFYPNFAGSMELDVRLL